MRALSARRISRREFLRGSAAVFLSTTVISGSKFDAVDQSELLMVKAKCLTCVFTNRESAMRVGAAYLDQHPGEGDLRHLMKIFTVNGYFQNENLQSSNKSSFLSAVQIQIRDDFANGRTASIEGWIMSLTELRLAALTTLV